MDWDAHYKNMVFRAELKEVLDQNKTKFQQVRATGLAGEELKLIRAQTFGLSTYPPAGSLGIGLAMGGNRENAMLIGGEMPGKRVTGDHGEGGTTIYDSEGNYMMLNNTVVTIKTQGAEIQIDPSGSISIKADTGITIEAPAVNLGGTAGAKRIRLEDGSLTSGVKAIN